MAKKLSGAARQAGQPASYGDSEDLRAQLAAELASAGKSVEQTETGELRVGNFTLGIHGLQYRGDGLSFEEWRDIGLYLQRHKDAIQWMIGDWANLAAPYLTQWVPESDKTNTPEGKYKWLAEQTGYSYSYLRSLASVAGRIDVYLREYMSEFVTFSHCRLLVSEDLSHEIMQEYFNRITEEKMSVSQLKLALGQALPASKTPAIVNRVNTLSSNWRKGWKKANPDTKRQVVEELRAILNEMEQDEDLDLG